MTSLAPRLLRAALQREVALERAWQIADVLLGLADIALARRQVRRAGLLLGAYEALRETVGYARHGWARDSYDRIAAVGARSATTRSAGCGDKAKALPLSAAVTEALAVADGPFSVCITGGRWRFGGAAAHAAVRDVLRLLVEGRSDRQIPRPVDQPQDGRQPRLRHPRQTGRRNSDRGGGAVPSPWSRLKRSTFPSL